MESNKFVAAKLALLSADVKLESSQVDAAWRRVQQRTPVCRTPWLALAAASIAAAVFLVTPPGRALAQSIWTSVVLRRAQPLELDFAATRPSLLLPNVFPMAPPGPSSRPPTQSDAERLTGFHIVTIKSPELPYEPTFRVEEPQVIERTIDMTAIRQDLAELGRPPVAEPPGVDGAKIVLRPQGRMVVTSYGTCPQIVGPWRACAFLVQSRPRVLEVPPHLNLELFTRFSLELAGLSPAQSEAVLALTRTAPTLFLPNEPGTKLEAVKVKGQPGVLMRYPDGVAFALLWQDTEFQYNLFGRNPGRAVAMAETLR